MVILFLMPAGDLPSKPFLAIPHFDKIVHFGLFFGLCILTFKPVKRLTPNFLFWTPIVTLILAIFLESIQGKISASRSTDIYDFWANLAGLSTAILFYRFFILGKKLEKLV